MSLTREILIMKPEEGNAHRERGESGDWAAAILTGVKFVCQA